MHTRCFAYAPVAAKDETDVARAYAAKDDDRRTKALARELVWMRMSPKARQSKSKARISNYEGMLQADEDARAVRGITTMLTHHHHYHECEKMVDREVQETCLSG
jgi:ATPase subunit of ABC transporter with duplicated ATPase domains